MIMPKESPIFNMAEFTKEMLRFVRHSEMDKENVLKMLEGCTLILQVLSRNKPGFIEAEVGYEEYINLGEYTDAELLVFVTAFRFAVDLFAPAIIVDSSVKIRDLLLLTIDRIRIFQSKS
jgi:hypothetical protein